MGLLGHTIISHIFWFLQALWSVRSGPIRIALTVDENSKKDFLIVTHSIFNAAHNSSNLIFHVVSCGTTELSATTLLKELSEASSLCLPSTEFVFVPFVLPPTSGFALQRDSAKQKSHWYSPTGADMARFFLPSIFPNAKKLLYFDNDIVVSCCIEEIWETNMADKIVGIALDDLKWATVTQFNNHYNASHPLVIKNVRRNMKNQLNPVTSDEFFKALPRYPNDGVLLINVAKYNSENILSHMDEIARANAHGEYVVGLGTQQFTVLLLHDRWTELTPRANLRHFPDMARGYLMWFYYNGVIHFAGQAKPRAVCRGLGSDNEHRVHTYSPWATTMFHLNNICPTAKILDSLDFRCAQHIPVASTFSEFMVLVQKIWLTNKDPALLYLRLGDFSGGSVREPLPREYLAANFSWDMRDTRFIPAQSNPSGPSGPSGSSHSVNTTHSDVGNTAIHVLDRFCLHETEWSGRVFDADGERVGKSSATLQQSLPTAALGRPSDPPPNSPMPRGKGGKKGKAKSKPTKLWTAQMLNMCDGLNFDSGVPFISSDELDAKIGCLSILLEIKRQGNKHWDVIGITIDYQPSPARPNASSLGVLRNIDLIFMRPKFIMVRLGRPSIEDHSGESKRTLHGDIAEAVKILTRNGFVARLDHTIPCDGNVDMSKTTPLQKVHFEEQDSTNEKTVERRTTSLSTIDAGEHWVRQLGSKVKRKKRRPNFVCIWATRVNIFEFEDIKYRIPT